ncbi:MAG: UDP-N-acetylmuramoyl-L-alanine--D-glutamate ligase [Candidatus Moranbacteria bacterium CG_4_8_14_3_um_filter_34_16]|nr:MAG: UDP-N-acetylmuramoyl-L-alanine--D-glutamate ligase [Candidatus Moranbacteria bacterium CG08_land_8_20_14_0_20_34_16]PIW95409.1 MAG: UDP-N-acetylmuramoyl-L-alanine--D-glutamate ligase [Candidatus Moranbacteria bacterium CG_4_8_14_3_um_filter_34_16]
MDKSYLKGKKITVMGLGILGGGEGAVRFLAEVGAIVTVTDIKSSEKLKKSVEKLKDLKNVKFILGQHRTEDFVKTDMVVKNPAVPWNNKHIKLALEKGVPVEMDSSLFFKLCQNSIVGVTGTKGKTTVSSLIYEILKADGKNVIKVGIGDVSVLDKLKMLKKNSVVVFELSSWRLSALKMHKISPSIAVITNIFPDHLNYYNSMEAYIADKKGIFLYQKKQNICVLNADNEREKKLEEEIKSQIIKFSRNRIISKRGVYAEDGIIYVNDRIDEKKLMEISEIKLRGEHNRENVLAAIAVAWSMGVNLLTIKKAVANFGGVKHRLEFVREINKVKYYNDTAATMPEAATVGIKSFSESVVLIGGGSDKKLDMSILAEAIKEKVSEAILLNGEATDKLILALKKINYANFKIVQDMREAVELARQKALPGQIVLLSPGAASFGLFSNEFERGDIFKQVVNEIDNILE